MEKPAVSSKLGTDINNGQNNINLNMKQLKMWTPKIKQ
jgi:hypothetical protein